LVTSLVENIFTPLIAAVFGEPDFSDLSFEVNESKILYGAFLNALISFVVIAFVLFLVVKAYNRFKEEQGEDPAGPSEVELLTEIRDALTRR
jgi:large conductance mechanosensitive channel